jgi:heme o synthase
MKGSSTQQGGRLRIYYQLTKPGIIYGNVMTGLAGLIFAIGLPDTHEPMGWRQLALRAFATIFGMALVIASACVVNNYIDRNIDKAMARTSTRALVTGAVSAQAAIIYAIVLGVVGVVLLLAFTPLIVTLTAAIAFIDYVVLYGLAKRKTVHSTLVGSISGAAPIFAGYTAISGTIDIRAVVLFVIMTAWQMPHFYAIAIYRAKDYAAAHLPVLPLVKGITRAKHEIIVYICLYVLATAALAFFIPHRSYLYAVPAVGGAVWWAFSAIKRYPRNMHIPKATTAGPANFSQTDTSWARKTFFQSLMVLLLLSAGLAIQTITVFL